MAYLGPIAAVATPRRAQPSKKIEDREECRFCGRLISWSPQEQLWFHDGDYREECTVIS